MSNEPCNYCDRRSSSGNDETCNGCGAPLVSQQGYDYFRSTSTPSLLYAGMPGENIPSHTFDPYSPEMTIAFWEQYRER